MKKNTRPHVVVFYGGTSGSRDLSCETGLWVCQYIPRSKYDVTPVEVTADGKWKVPLGSLPRSGFVKRTLDMLSQATRPLSPAKALERLFMRPIAAMMTVVRGKGGDDGTLHSLGQALSIPVVGSPPHTCQRTHDKHACAQVAEDIVGMPRGMRWLKGTPIEQIVAEARQEFMPPLFVKPAAEEGSVGVSQVSNNDDLATAISAAQANGDILIQESIPGQEISVTLVEDSRGKVYVLPPTLIVPQKATFYDHMAKRRAGRVKLHTPEHRENPVLWEAESIARDVYDELGCRGIATIDLVARDGDIQLLEVNTVPTLSEWTPLAHQLRAARTHPSRLIDNIVQRTIEGL